MIINFSLWFKFKSWILFIYHIKKHHADWFIFHIVHRKFCQKESFFSIILKIWAVHLQILLHNQIHMHKSLSFSWLNIISRTFNWVSWKIIMFLYFVHSNILYCLSCNYMQVIILYLHVILARLVHKSFYFVVVLWFFLFYQQNYLYQSVIIVLSWDHNHWFWFMIQIQVMNLVHMSYRKVSCQLIHFSYCSQKILSKRVIFFNHFENMSSTFANTAS